MMFQAGLQGLIVLTTFIILSKHHVRGFLFENLAQAGTFITRQSTSSEIRSDTFLFARRQPRPRRHRKAGDSPISEELELFQREFFPILGSDESGRGCIAGPIVAATCCILVPLKDYTPIKNVQDSKALTPIERQRIYQHVMDNPDTYGWNIAQRSHQEIDESNILLATTDCFKESIDGLIEKEGLTSENKHNPYSIVDGKKTPKLDSGIPCRPFVKADASVYTVSLASILAKVEHDRIMTKYHEEYPEYGFNTHMGYQKPEHVEAVHKHGPCPIHRLSYKALKGRS